MMLAMMMAVTFVACNDDPDPITPEPVNPTIAVNGGAEAIIIDMEALPVSANVEVTSEEADLAYVYVYIHIDAEGLPAFDYPLGEPIVLFEEGTKTWSDAYIFSQEQMEGFIPLIPEGAVLTFNVEARTADNGEKAVSLPIEIINIYTPTLLEGPEGFTWHRDGGNKAEGLDVFGLDWPSNSNDFMVVITPLADCKLVQFETAQWTSITTQEDLAALVEAGVALTDFRLIPAKDDTKTFNYVLGSRNKDGKYFLLNPTKREIIGDANRYITGEYKY